MAFLLHQLLREAAERDPLHEAVRCRGHSLTYQEVDSAANALARTLIGSGVGKGDRVGIYLPKSIEVLPALYGTMRAGAAYVPMDPRGPIQRAAAIAADCSISALITTPDFASALASTGEPPHPKIAVLIGSGDHQPMPFPVTSYEAAAADSDVPDPSVAVIENDLAYILYTSGSTGAPKGVMLSHRNALTFLEWCAAAMGVGPDDRLSNHAPLHFDLSVFDLYLAAYGGATVVLIPEEEAFLAASLSRFIMNEGITVWYSVPTALRMLVQATSGPGEYPTLRAVVFAGEVYPTPHLRELREVLPEPDLWNLYGPTETNVCTYYRVIDLPADDRAIPIGRACDNAEVFALKEDGTRAGVGEQGELFVRGPSVMKGYWGLPEKTAEVLIPDPLNQSLGDLVYRTGDLVRLRADQDYDFLGRRDDQIKSRGYRIELGEVEASLAAHPAVEEAVAIAIPHEDWGTAVVARVVPRAGQTPSPRDLKAHVARLLPRYMVPADIQIARSLPRTLNGKIDRTRVFESISSANTIKQ